MHKAPLGRVETIHQALAPDLRNLPIPAPSERIDGALSRAAQDVASLKRGGGDGASSSACRSKGQH